MIQRVVNTCHAVCCIVVMLLPEVSMMPSQRSNLNKTFNLLTGVPQGSKWESITRHCTQHRAVMWRLSSELYACWVTQLLWLRCGQDLTINSIWCTAKGHSSTGKFYSMLFLLLSVQNRWYFEMVPNLPHFRILLVFYISIFSSSLQWFKHLSSYFSLLQVCWRRYGRRWIQRSTRRFGWSWTRLRRSGRWFAKLWRWRSWWRLLDDNPALKPLPRPSNTWQHFAHKYQTLLLLWEVDYAN